MGRFKGAGPSQLGWSLSTEEPMKLRDRAESENCPH